MAGLTTAEALWRYSTELNEAGFGPELVERLVMMAAQEIVAAEGLSIRGGVAA